ncbi:MAG: polyphosphate polymerase domain-containing protein [Tannerella sp.]|jgi:hypothetical protein|nr:polyphosphate polymerase domain-containing protein [Tannerella sp.]
MNTPINSPVLERMTTITLKEMKHIRLMDRMDFKFIASASLLPQLLEEIAPFFKVQVNNERRMAPYSTQYLDTSRLDMFLMHQNGKLNRQKIRIRSYMDSGISFLEVKNKNNKGRTTKVRIPTPLSHIRTLDDMVENQSFLDENSLFDSRRLEPALANRFNRITLVNNRATERVTIDTHLSFFNYMTGQEKALEGIAVLELKQDGWRHSDFREALNRLRIKPVSFSKYCMGTVLTNQDAKYNRFKPKWTIINKLTNQ